MENKKQLIIIPPMSEALKKLHEVLEGISVDENVEISLIDDLKELSQFLGTTGQCLILASNAKKCATFLQENKSMLAKHHCKTILFTPKEIPHKTLIKFTKIGLTESILESSPPKTFLYKVKLLLRSIKTSKNQEENEKLVKSLDVSKTVGADEEEREVKDKIINEENVIDIERQSKKKNDSDNENVIDYGNPLKGKIKPQEETIDTHWKSDRKKTQDLLDETSEEKSTLLADENNLDMYYRGKSKKSDIEISPEEDIDSNKKLSIQAQEEEKERKKSQYADVIDEGSMKQKRLNVEEETFEESAPKKLDQLEIEASLTRKKNIQLEEEVDLFAKRQSPELPVENENEKDADTKQVEDLGGYLKGKISNENLLIEEEPEISDKKEYDNSELDSKKEKKLDIKLENSSDKKRKKEDNEDLEDKDPHEGEVDKIDNNMIGDAGTVDKIRTRMEGKSGPQDAELENEDSYEIETKKKQRSNEKDVSDLEKKSLDLEKNDTERDTSNQKEDDTQDEDSLTQKKQIQLEKNESGRERNKTLNEEDDNSFQKKESGPLKELERSGLKREALQKEDSEKRERESSGLDLNKQRETRSHTSQVDKIDTFYRSGESSKKKEHSWDNLTDKNDQLELGPGKNRKSDSNGKGNGDGKNLGEVTIDYRKLKEEFEMMAMGQSGEEAHHSRTNTDSKLKNDDDDGSFKVIETEAMGVDFSIAIINLIYSKEVKSKQIFSLISDELITNYHCYPIFYQYKTSAKSFNETFNSFSEITGEKMPLSKKEWWDEKKKETEVFLHYQSKSMTTWRCPEIIQNNESWEDVELPSWAAQELKDKAVELIFPYFDGLDRMGMAIIYFPEGLDPKVANSVLTTLEMARTLFLDTIERYQVRPQTESREEKTEDNPSDANNKVLSFIGGLFGKKKAS